MMLQVQDLDRIEDRLGITVTETVKQSVRRAVNRHKSMLWFEPSVTVAEPVITYVSKEVYDQLSSKYDSILEFVSETYSKVDESSSKYNEILQAIEKLATQPTRVEPDSALQAAYDRLLAESKDTNILLNTLSDENKKLTEHINQLSVAVSERFDANTKHTSELQDLVKKVKYDITEKVELLFATIQKLTHVPAIGKRFPLLAPRKRVQVDAELDVREDLSIPTLDISAEESTKDVVKQIKQEINEQAEILFAHTTTQKVEDTASADTSTIVSKSSAPEISESKTENTEAQWVSVDLVHIRGTLLKLSQAKLAKLLGISRSTYQHYERDTRLPKILCQPVDDLLKKSGLEGWFLL